MSFDITNDVITCPYCETVINDDDPADDEGVIKCEHCGKRYNFYKYEIIEFTTTRSCKLNKVKHSWGDWLDMFGHDKKCRMCNSCGAEQTKKI